MRVNFDGYYDIVRSVKEGGWNYSFKEAGTSNPASDTDRDKIKSCTHPAPEEFKNECDFLVIQRMGNGYSCRLWSELGKRGHAFNAERGYEFGASWKELHKIMKENHAIIIPSDRQIERIEDFVSRVNGNDIDLRKYEDFIEYVEY